MSLPNSVIYICRDIKLDRTYQNTIYFETEQDQQTFFSTHMVTRFEEYTLLRKNRAIQVQASYNEAKGWNYLYYTNPGDSLTYYNFINEVRYINESTVELEIELDLMQTYAFTYELLPSFVEREHTYSDEPGEHTLEEGLEVGDLVTAYTTSIPELERLCVLVNSSIDIAKSVNANDTVAGSGLGWEGVYSGIDTYGVKQENYSDLTWALQFLDSKGWGDAILGMWVYPEALVKFPANAGALNLDVVMGTQLLSVELMPYTECDLLFEGHKPRNNKLYVFPYNLLYVSNNAGSCAQYKWERFNSPDEAVFSVMGGIAPDATAILAPDDYAGCTLNFEEGLSLGNFPTCAWNSDPYKIWLAQNQNSQAVQMDQLQFKVGASTVKSVASALTLDFGGAVSGVESAVDAMYQQKALVAQKRDMDVQPHQAKGHHSMSTNIFWDKQNFTFYYKTVTKEYAKIITRFFDMYGYQVNTVKIPNPHNRLAYTYIRTVGCNLNGDIPRGDLTKIKTIFDKGITFWTNGEFIGEYDWTNTPLSNVFAITFHPMSLTLSEGSIARFTVGATGKGLTYQWQWSNGGAWNNNTGVTATTKAFEIEATQTRNGFRYRCKVTDENGDVLYCNPATLTVI